MTDEPKTETLEIPKLEIPNFDDADKHTFENYANKYPKFDFGYQCRNDPKNGFKAS